MSKSAIIRQVKVPVKLTGDRTNKGKHLYVIKPIVIQGEMPSPSLSPIPLKECKI